MPHGWAIKKVLQESEFPPPRLSGLPDHPLATRNIADKLCDSGTGNESQKGHAGDSEVDGKELQAQVTREFRRFSIYIGGENLIDYTIKNPIRGASDPWKESFDATQVWGPVNGAMGYVGIRLKFESF